MDYSLSADVVVGGRYIPEPGATSCDLPGFELVTVPWLVPGFEAGTIQDADTDLRYRTVCRDKDQPYASEDMEEANLTFSGSNPVPDGRSRQRHLELVDGALVNQSQMVIIFRESFPDSFSFVDAADADDFSAYGIMVLERNPTTLDDDAFVGSLQTETRTMPEDKLSVSCTDEIVEQARVEVIVFPRTARKRIDCIIEYPWYAGSREMKGCAGQRQDWKRAMRGADRSGDRGNGGSFGLFANDRTGSGP